MVAPDDFNPADLTTVLQVLRAANIPADTDPTLVRVPGVWLRFDGFELDQLHGLSVRTTVHVIVSETEQARALAAVAAKFNEVKAALRAAGLEVEGTATLVGVVLPGSATPLPALAVPLPLYTCQE